MFTYAILTYLIVKTKGTAQIGNWLSFSGSTILMAPPLFQLIGNRKIIKSLRDNMNSEYYKEIAPYLEKARIKEFTMYNPRDLGIAILGFGLTSAGFGINLINSEELIASPALDHSDAINPAGASNKSSFPVNSAKQ